MGLAVPSATCAPIEAVQTAAIVDWLVCLFVYLLICENLETLQLRANISVN